MISLSIAFYVLVILNSIFLFIVDLPNLFYKLIFRLSASFMMVGSVYQLYILLAK